MKQFAELEERMVEAQINRDVVRVSIGCSLRVIGNVNSERMDCSARNEKFTHRYEQQFHSNKPYLWIKLTSKILDRVDRACA